MALATRTTNPLPFGDLEPKPFEDLVRQLLYDFRIWRKLEGTGRAGSDDGYDARGFEAVQQANEDDEDQDQDTAVAAADRVWLIQCKRETSIGPAKLLKYLEEIPPGERSQLYGIIMAAPCNFSKSARDRMDEWARPNGISETHVWGRGELEDQLFQPKSDHLLFAYFGISLQIRRRTLQSQLRSKLAMKKRVETALGAPGAHHFSPMLLRDPEDQNYPYLPPEGRRRPWRLVTFLGHHPRGVLFQAARHFAIVEEDGSWDIVDDLNLARAPIQDPWDEKDPAKEKRRQQVLAYWETVPDSRRANYTESAVIPYEEILGVDAVGDEYARCPHIYVLEKARLQGGRVEIKAIEPLSEPIYPDPKLRRQLFPLEISRPSKGD